MRLGRRAARPSGVSGWGESTFAEMAWDKSRGAATRWAVGGAVLGALIGVIAFAPAAWLASAVGSASGERVLLAEARGTVWSGSAVPVLTGGPQSRDAAALPGRLEWSLTWKGLSFDLGLRQACCINGTVVFKIKPGIGRTNIALVPPADGWIAQWPSAWLVGLGTPFNTLQLGGALRLASPELMLESVQGRWRLQGHADLDILSASSRVSTLDRLGSYRFTVAGAGDGTSTMTLLTTEGPLQLSGNGQWGARGVRFRGEATAGPAHEPALSNLLNIIGRRNGARSVISIG